MSSHGHTGGGLPDWAGRRMPITAAAALLAGLSMAGAPGFIGAFAKDLLFTVQLGVPGLLPAVALVVNAAMVVVAGVVAARPFMGKPMETRDVAKDPPPALLVGRAVDAVRAADSPRLGVDVDGETHGVVDVVADVRDPAVELGLVVAAGPVGREGDAGMGRDHGRSPGRSGVTCPLRRRGEGPAVGT